MTEDESKACHGAMAQHLYAAARCALHGGDLTREEFITLTQFWYGQAAADHGHDIAAKAVEAIKPEVPLISIPGADPRPFWLIQYNKLGAPRWACVQEASAYFVAEPYNATYYPTPEAAAMALRRLGEMRRDVIVDDFAVTGLGSAVRLWADRVRSELNIAPEAQGDET